VGAAAASAARRQSAGLRRRPVHSRTTSLYINVLISAVCISICCRRRRQHSTMRHCLERSEDAQRGRWYKWLGSSAHCCWFWRSRRHVTCRSPVQCQHPAPTRIRPPTSTYSCHLFSRKWCVHSSIALTLQYSTVLTTSLYIHSCFPRWFSLCFYFSLRLSMLNSVVYFSDSCVEGFQSSVTDYVSVRCNRIANMTNSYSYSQEKTTSLVCLCKTSITETFYCSVSDRRQSFLFECLSC